jgi:hypothetical protein
MGMIPSKLRATFPAAPGDLSSSHLQQVYKLRDFTWLVWFNLDGWFVLFNCYDIRALLIAK